MLPDYLGHHWADRCLIQVVLTPKSWLGARPDLQAGSPRAYIAQWTTNRRHDQICPILRSRQIANLRGNQSYTRKGPLALGIEIGCIPYSREPSSELKHTPNSSVYTLGPLTLGKAWLEDIMKFNVTVWDPLDWRLSPSFLEIVFERGYILVMWSLVSNESPSKDPSLYTEGLLSLSCMGGSGLNWIWFGAGIQDHILRKVPGLGRRPSLNTQPFFPRWPPFPEAGPGQHSAVSSETGSCQLGKCTGWALLVTPLTVVQLALAFEDKVPGPLHCAGALGRRWQLCTDILSSPT